MSTFEDATKLLASLTRGEKAQILQMVARDIGDAYPGIESFPAVFNGQPYVVRTQVPVWLLEQARRAGFTEAEILETYPTMLAVDLANSWAYVRSHLGEIEQQIQLSTAD